MRSVLLLTAALATTVPLSSQSNSILSDPEIRNGELVWFTLQETKEALVKQLGPPALVTDFGSDFRAWQFKIGLSDHHEFSHSLTFRRSTGALVSVARNFERDTPVSALFPKSQSMAFELPQPDGSRYGVLIRRLPDDRVLMAMGARNPEQPTGQLVLMRSTEVRHFYPALFELMQNGRRRD